ncbi:Putative SMAD6 interacting protein AMSH [Penicillium brasilianum]|uniref:Putative SMAD6 interacting protein AMSH n=1 Tax=Penicillium brasilianum TaxID=104259 RepID=A0A0F7TKW9_PENBI|nr:Putative SMAD6 interacting protein AMSH [Penicillium brasilianum]
MASQVKLPTAGGSPPQSVEKITRIAQDYSYTSTVALRYWLRTAATLTQEAQIYEREGHDEQAYLLLFRHAQLVLVHLSKHPDAQKNGKDRQLLLQAEKEVEKNLAKLEALKPRINKRYERYTQLMRERQSRKLSSESNTLPESRERPADPALTGVAQPLEAGENRDLAVRLAHSELNRRATVRSRRAAGDWGDWENAYKKEPQASDHDLSQRIQNIRINLDNKGPAGQSQHRSQPTTRDTSSTAKSTYKYPSVPRQKPLEPIIPAAQIAIRDNNAERHTPPVLPPKQLIEPSQALLVDGAMGSKLPLSSHSSKVSQGPRLPEKVRLPEDSPPANPELDPSSYTFKPSAYLENGTPLRSVFLPASLRTRFLSLAAANTKNNLETCGILCGALVSNALFISRLVIPEQIATSDTCETTNESALFDYCDSEDLIMLGWIHTHPTQTCFMSSRDLHTHSGYQVMLPESIAIVCAPSKNPDWGVFRLTDPPGLKTVLNCTQTGLFHPHAEENIYTGALRPGHVFEVNGLEYETVDLRPKGQRT